MKSTTPSIRTLVLSATILSLALVVLVATPGVASACPSCQAALAGDGEHGDLARGIYYSILFMMSMPFAIIGTFSFMAYRAVKNEQRRQAEAKAQADDESRG
jgi:hypothetical protein